MSRRPHIPFARIEKLLTLWGAISLVIIIAGQLIAAVKFLEGYALREGAIVDTLITIMGWGSLVVILTVASFLTIGAIVVLVMLMAERLVHLAEPLLDLVNDRLERISKRFENGVRRLLAIASGRLVAPLFIIGTIFYVAVLLVAAGWLVLHFRWARYESELTSVLAAAKSVLTELSSVLSGPAEVAGWVWLGSTGLVLLSVVFHAVRFLWLKLPSGIES
jgi:hypothetical protein